ncbi:MAG: T9SS type A sorting domain-containing protein [Sphingobacteriales bacterium]|nr:MAG: T9SS type A sorting domain-containing protein [Sphingobacteriales bacterium]
MNKQLLFSIALLLQAFIGFTQGSESFTNSNNGGAGSNYATRTWTGDNGLTWTATSARNDEQGTVTGMNGDFIIVRNASGIISCAGIPNGCGQISFKYARAFTSATLPTFAVFINSVQYGPVVTASGNAAQTFTVTVDEPGSFDLEIRQLTASDNGRLAIDSIVWTGSNNNPPCEEPTAQPTSLNLSSTPNTVTGNFTAAMPTAGEYLVVRSTSATLSAAPVDGGGYAAGQALGGGTVVGSYTGTSFTDANLVANTQYYYFVFAFNNEDCNGGPNYLSTNSLTGSVATQPLPACTTPAAATNLNLTSANNFISGNFTAVAGSNRYLVVISTSATIGATPTNGVTYTQGQVFGSGTVVSFNTAANFAATGLNTLTQYYLYVFTASMECSGQPVYSSTSLNGNISTTNNSTGIPTGYYDAANGLSCQPLKTALKNIISAGAVNIGYDGLWTAYQYTDIKPGTTNLIWDIYTDDNNPAVPETYNFVYSDDQCGNYNSEGDCYNREHSTPKSWFNDASPMHNDIFHVVPTDGWVNGKRSNYPYGDVTNASFTSIDNQSKVGTGNNFGYTGTVFQPFSAFRGDVARMSLYMATRYEDQIISQNWAGNAQAGPAMLTAGEEGLDAAARRLQVYNTWYLRTMFKWMNEDPVSQKEIDRNNAVYYQSGQNNRNPFVDRPEYAALIWECTGALPVTITDFTAARNASSIVLRWYATYETNFKRYDIERSINGINFYKVGEVEGKNYANYSFEDAELPAAAQVYYRLKMIDIDGTFSNSKTVVVRLNNYFSKAIIYPNPASTSVTVKLSDPVRSNSFVTISDLAGRSLKQQSVRRGESIFVVDVQQLPAGRYFLKVNDAQTVINQSFVIIK